MSVATALRLCGGASIVLGGLTAAVTDPLDLEHGSWAAAYLVLVGGVMQYAMGWARNPTNAPTPRGMIALAGWNAGNAAVIAGVMTDAVWAVDVGAVVLIAVLLAAAYEATARRGDRSASLARTPIRAAYAALLVFVAGSIPVGIVLAHVRR